MELCEIFGFATLLLHYAPRMAVPPSPRAFVGREPELRILADSLLSSRHAPAARAWAIHGLGGVGKTYLVEQFAKIHAERFPGGLVRLSLLADDPRDEHALFVALADSLGLRVGEIEPALLVRERLLSPRALFHVDNVNSRQSSMAVTSMVRRLEDCVIIVTGRYAGLGVGSGWGKLPLASFSEGMALEQLAAEGCAPQDDAERADQRRLVRALGGLPLALHLSAGHLRQGRSAGWLLEQLRTGGVKSDAAETEPSLDTERSRALLKTVFELSLARLREQLGPKGDRLVDGFAALGFAPPNGVGSSLGAAMCGLGEDEFGRLSAGAVSLSLASVRSEGEQSRIQVHALLRELLRAPMWEASVTDRMTGWFVERLPDLPGDRVREQGARWRAVQAETESLVWWLQKVPEGDLVKVADAGSDYALINGPYAAWIAFGERVLSMVKGDTGARSNALWRLANLAERSGSLDQAMAFAEDMLAIAQERKNERDEALAQSVIAGIKMTRGEVDTGLLTHFQEVLPRLQKQRDGYGAAVILGKIAATIGNQGDYDKAIDILANLLALHRAHGDLREQMVTLSQIADIRLSRGESAQALRIYQDDALPLANMVGDLHAQAAILARIAGVLHLKGESERALAIYKDEALPAIERTGNIPERAALLTSMSDVFQNRGDLAEALRLLREEALPVFDRIGDTRNRSGALQRIGNILRKQGKPREALEIYEGKLLPLAEKQGDRALYAGLLVSIAQVHETLGEVDTALEIYRRAAADYKNLGNAHQWAVTVGKTASILRHLGKLDEAMLIYRDPQIRDILERNGDIRSQIGILTDSVDILQDQGEHERALETLESEILAEVERLGEARTTAVYQSRIADIHVALGRTSNAARIYRDNVIPVIEQQGSMSEKGWAWYNFANVVKKHGSLDEAYQMLEKRVVPAFEATENLPALAGAIASMVDILHARGELEEATAFFPDHIEPLADKSGDARGRASALRTVANALRLQGSPPDLDHAEKLLEEALALCDEAAYPNEHASALAAFALLYLSLGELNTARERREKQIAIYDRLGKAHLSAIAKIGLATLLRAQGNPEQARTLLEVQVLAALARPGDIQARAQALGELSNAWLAESRLDEALQVAEQQELPLLEKIEDARAIVATRHRIGRILLRRDSNGDREAAEDSLLKAEDEAKRMSLREARAIARLRRSIHMDSIVIRNFKNIKQLDLSFRKSSRLPGRFTCIAGRNGAGKSAVLQAIALALLGAHSAPEIGQKWLKEARRRENGQIHKTSIEAQARIGNAERPVRITIGDEGIDVVDLASTDSYPSMKELWDEREQHQLLLSYGAGRNLSDRLSGQYRNLSDDVQRQMTLFNPLGEVASAEVLVEQRPDSALLLPLLKRLLGIMLQDTQIQVAPDRDKLRFSMNGASVPPSDLPDGFRAMVAWLGDLCAVWLAKAPDEAKSGDPSSIRGIVLIDEIDLHLHPRLQRSLIPRLRRALPEVQWIVTTHSPLILSSFDRSELIVLDSSAETGVRELDRQILGFSMDEVYQWLMETEPRSAALTGPIDDEQLGLLLAQSPEVNEERARETQEIRRKLVERIRQKDAKQPPERP